MGENTFGLSVPVANSAIVLEFGGLPVHIMSYFDFRSKWRMHAIYRVLRELVRSG